jgi:hypothetical protein
MMCTYTLSNIMQLLQVIYQQIAEYQPPRYDSLLALRWEKVQKINCFPTSSYSKGDVIICKVMYPQSIT